jgi:hypothetical protein
LGGLFCKTLFEDLFKHLMLRIVYYTNIIRNIGIFVNQIFNEDQLALGGIREHRSPTQWA